MIQIRRYKLDDLAMIHYNRLVTTVGRRKSLLDRIQGKANYHRKRKRNFYLMLLDDVILTGGKSILIDGPERLRDTIELYNLEFPDLMEDENFLDQVAKVFYYDKYEKWGAYKLANALDVKVCPYCNRQYTFTLGNDIDGGVRPEFDHFFYQQKYPYLSLSFYNLIPSCHTCNSNLKGKDEFDLDKNVHPYLEDANDYISFTIDPTTVSFAYGDATAYEVKFKPKSGAILPPDFLSRFEKNKEVFRLEELYAQHKDYIDEIIQKSIAYSQDHYENLLISFAGTLFNNIDDVKRMVLSNYVLDEDLDKRVLAKLTKDVAVELGIL